MLNRVVKTNRKLTAQDVIKTSVLTFLLLAVVFSATIIKYAMVKSFSAHSVGLYFCILAAYVCLIGVWLTYVLCFRREMIVKFKYLAAITCIMGITFTAGMFLELISVYLVPMGMAAFLIAPLSRRQDAFNCNIFCCILLSFALLTQRFFSGGGYGDLFCVSIIGLFGGALGAFLVSADARRLSYLLRGIGIAVLSGVAATVLIRLYRLPSSGYAENFSYLSISLVGQVIVGLVLQPVFESIFNLVTNTRLVELTDHNHPLIRRLIAEAPGTFNHCLAVANFAEICAGAIGENPYLARACAYYHDIGKLSSPQYFKENQADTNPHDGLLPEVSAEIIRSHTTEGLKMCRQHRLPDEIAQVTIQHHGTLPIFLFYSKAKQLTDGEVDIEEYSYHGVKPVSKIAAIIMLCDSSEAAIRAMGEPDGERVDKLLRSIIVDRISTGQFDNCNITLRDLDVIRVAIIDAYGGLYHKRLKYPDGGNL